MVNLQTKFREKIHSNFLYLYSLGSPSITTKITTKTILFLQCRPNSDEQRRLMLARKARTYRKKEILQGKGLRWKEDAHSSVHRTSLSEFIPVARIRPVRPETRRELQRAARNTNITGICLDARTQSLSSENRS